MEPKKHYYYLENRYRSTKREGGSGHVIKAWNLNDAMHIAKKYEVGSPMGAKDILDRCIIRLHLSNEEDVKLIKRRQAEIGGCIWYEDNEKLKKETT